MEQCHSSEAALSSVIQEIHRVSRKPSIHYRLHNSQPRVLNLSQMNHNSLKLITILSSHVHIDLQRDLLPSGFKTRSMYACFWFNFSPTWTNILCSLVRYDSHNNIWSGLQALRLWLNTILQPPVPSYPSGPNTFCCTLLSNTLRPGFISIYPRCKRKGKMFTWYRPI